MRIGQVGLCRVRLGMVVSGMVWSGQVEPGLVRQCEVLLAGVRSGLVSHGF